MTTDNFNQRSVSLHVGMYNMQNGSCVDKIDAHDMSNVRSVVAYIDEEQHYAIGLCPVNIMLPFAHGCLLTNTEYIKRGKEATKVLLEEAAKQGINLPAAEFCYNYNRNNVEKGEAFLPSKHELNGINRSAVWSSWKKLGLLSGDLTFWSSSIGFNYNVWMNSCSANAITGWQIQYRTFGFMPAIEINI